MKKYIIIIILFLQTHMTMAENASDNPYESLKLNSLQVYQTFLGFYSPYLQVNSNYKLFNKNFTYTKTLSIFGECTFLPYPLRYCARIDKYNGKVRACVYQDNQDLNDFHPFAQPLNNFQSFTGDNSLKSYLDEIGIKLDGYINKYTFSDYYAFSGASYIYNYLKGAFQKRFNNETVSYACADLPVPPFINDATYNNNYEENLIFPNSYVEKTCEEGKTSKSFAPCAIDNTDKSSFDEMYVYINLITPANFIPMDGYFDKAAAANGNLNVFIATPSNPLNTYPDSVLNFCPLNSNNITKHCIKLNNTYSSEHNAEATTIVQSPAKVVYMPNISSTNYSPDSINFKPIGVIRNGFIKVKIDFSKEQYSGISLPFVDNNWKTVNMSITGVHYKNDDYVCFTGDYGKKLPLGCVKRPIMPKPILEKCNIDIGCQENYTENNPIFKVTIPTKKNENNVLIIKAGEIKAKFNHEFMILPVNTSKKEIALKADGSYTNKSADKFCLYGYSSKIGNTITKRSPDDFIVPISAFNFIVKSSVFWKDGFIAKDNDELTESEAYELEFKPEEHFISELLPLHDESDNPLCLNAQ
ncbi:MAG: hypothetical protein J0H68_05410 [Sphingobacteriia bacterium]|nr:hypothetical protein [Sphingobacteriia bacterium]